MGSPPTLRVSLFTAHLAAQASGRSSGVGNSNPLQYSCLENSIERGAWRAAVHGVAKSQTRLSSTVLVCKVICLSGKPLTCSVLSPSCLQARSPFCVPCDLRAICGLPSDPQGQSVHSALGSSRVRTEGSSGTHILLNQAQIRTVTTPWKQPPDRAGRGCFLLH